MLLLAFLTEEERRSILTRTGLPRFTPRTITNSKVLESHLAEIRRTGFAVSHEERAPLLSSISVPIRDFRGGVVAALCVDGPSGRFTPAKEARFLKLAVQAADQISQEIGYDRRARGAIGADGGGGRETRQPR